MKAGRRSMAERLRDWAWLNRFRLRARFDRRFGVPLMAGRPGPAGAGIEASDLPKRIWIYWEQGWDAAPELVRLCRRSWEEKNPDWEVVGLGAGSIHAYMPRSAWEPREGMRRNHKANLLRLHLLADHGGVWADATTFCSSPLSVWLPPLMPTGFFAFSRPGADRLLSTWFLAAVPHHPLLQRWRLISLRYWRLVAKADFYFWFPYLFAELCRSDPSARAVWAATPHVSADGAHRVQWHAADPEAREAIARSLAAGDVPVHKLDWRLELPRVGDATPLGLLLGL